MKTQSNVYIDISPVTGGYISSESFGVVVDYVTNDNPFLLPAFSTYFLL